MQEIYFELDGKAAKKAYFVSHHLAHAYYAFGHSPFSNALVITFDGLSANDFSGGGIYFGRTSTCQPVFAHGFWCGTFYERVGERLGLGVIGGAGKLMGLAAYGVPAYVANELTGSLSEMQCHGTFANGAQIADYWLEKMIGDKTLPKWDGQSFPPEMIANLACSAQAIFANNVLSVAERAVARAEKVGFAFDGICLSGGCALNCPSNTLLSARYGKVFVPPAVNDEGLAIGSSIALAKDWKRPVTSPQIAFVGNAYPPTSNRGTEKRLALVAEGEEALVVLAQNLFEGRIAGFYYGRAEVGPRALGHRSILASAFDAKTTDRVNKIKNRELWRPFAPISTREKYGDYFSHLPQDSYFMLFNAISKTRLLPAVTHIDGTARVQVVTSECGPVYELLRAFEKISGHPVLLNTSFNGRNEPIVETPDHALQAFLKMPLDMLYLDGRLFVKSDAES